MAVSQRGLDTHEGIICNACRKNNFRCVRNKCMVCYHYDLCNGCQKTSTATTRHAADHPMQRILTKINAGITCDGCKKINFHWDRYKCMICYHYDLCMDCRKTGTATTRHAADHPMHRTSTLNRTAIITCNACDTDFHGPRFTCMVCYDYDLCTDCQIAVTATTRHAADHPMHCIPTRDNPGITCDACKQTDFIGPRFMCMVCFDYNLCTGCQRTSTATTRHAADHPMQRILTRANAASLYGDEALSTEQLGPLCCPYCFMMGFTANSLAGHIGTRHADFCNFIQEVVTLLRPAPTAPTAPTASSTEEDWNVGLEDSEALSLAMAVSRLDTTDSEVSVAAPAQVSGATPASGDGPSPRPQPAKDVREELQCPVCLEMFRQATTLGCGHTFCAGCLQQMRASGGNRCPQCRAAITSAARSVALDNVIKSLFDKE